MKLKESLYKISIIKELGQRIKKYLRYFSGSYQKYKDPTWKKGKKTLSVKKIAVICDEFTWKSICLTTNAVYLTVSNWRDQLEDERPDILFCEATWKGINNEWDNHIYRNYKFKYDNRYVLKDILKYCKNAGIKTVFWNKEDTPRFYDKPFSFIDTAILFDHIFTTSIECIPKYKNLGHNSVHLMMFGYSPEIFFIKKARPKTNTVVFLGSWYSIFQERCKDMCQIFDMLLEQGFRLKIYDRLSSQNQRDRIYPLKYKPYIFPAVSYEETADIMNEADYVININTVKDSETMFARRVFEAMACGRIVISNDSVGMKKIFPNAVWYVNEPFDKKNEEFIIRQNLKKVSTQFTFEAQLRTALREIDIRLE